MKIAFIILLAAGTLSACNDSGNTVTINTDSLGQKLEAGVEKAEDKIEEGWDSTKSKARDLKEKVEDRLDSTRNNRKDSLSKQ